MLRYYWLSVVVVYIVQGCAPLLSYESVRDGTTSRDWDWIVQQGVMTENEEVGRRRVLVVTPCGSTIYNATNDNETCCNTGHQNIIVNG